MRKKIVLLFVMVGLLTACGVSNNKDPRYGKVITDTYDCIYGTRNESCSEAYNICQGPDLVYVDRRLEQENVRIENSEKCKPEE